MNDSESIEDRADSERPPSWKIYVPLAVLGELVLLTIAYMAYNSERMSRVHAPLIGAAMEIKLGGALAHLCVEEIATGDTSLDVEEVRGYLKRAEWFAKAML